MVPLTVLTSILGYLIIGTLLARITFKRVLGDSERYWRHRSGGRYWTSAMERALPATILMWLFWPVLGPASLMWAAILKPTPAEDYRDRMAQLEEDERKLGHLIEKYGLTDLVAGGTPGHD